MMSNEGRDNEYEDIYYSEEEGDNYDVTKLKRNDELQFPEFDNIKVSTKTFIVITNLNLDLSKIKPPEIPITDYVIVPKRRGRKRKTEEVDPNKGIADGSIITIEYKGEIYGVDLKKKKNSNCGEEGCNKIATHGTGKGKALKCCTHSDADMVSMRKEKGNYFRNSVTVVMMIEGKRVNFKISSNGKFQMTGCKYDRHAEKITEYIWKYIKQQKDIYTIRGGGDKLEAIFRSAMTNIDFPLGFLVNREQLDRYINMHTEYRSLLETSFGYTGVNIKIPVTEDIRELQLNKLIFHDDGKVDRIVIKNGDYLNTLTEKEVNKELTKKRNVTFLVFHSGSTITSGMNRDLLERPYRIFTDIIRNCYDLIEEKLDV